MILSFLYFYSSLVCGPGLDTPQLGMCIQSHKLSGLQQAFLNTTTLTWSRASQKYFLELQQQCLTGRHWETDKFRSLSGLGWSQ